MKCSICGKEIDDDSNFCEYCGTRVKSSNGNKPIGIILAILFILCFILGSIAIIMSGNKVDTESEYSDMVSVPLGYVDLGLSSGTYWKADNESELYDYDEAMNLYGSSLPTREQWEELRNECAWEWNGSGYQVTGSNGKSIVLPAAGYRAYNGGIGGVGSYGHYWSSTPSGSGKTWDFNFNSGSVIVSSTERCLGLSVRLVQD